MHNQTENAFVVKLSSPSQNGNICHLLNRKPIQSYQPHGGVWWWECLDKWNNLVDFVFRFCVYLQMLETEKNQKSSIRTWNSADKLIHDIFVKLFLTTKISNTIVDLTYVYTNNIIMHAMMHIHLMAYTYSLFYVLLHHVLYIVLKANQFCIFHVIFKQSVCFLHWVQKKICSLCDMKEAITMSHITWWVNYYHTSPFLRSHWHKCNSLQEKVAGSKHWSCDPCCYQQGKQSYCADHASECFPCESLCTSGCCHHSEIGSMDRKTIFEAS